jgi:hypothetical protein
MLLRTLSEDIYMRFLPAIALLSALTVHASAQDAAKPAASAGDAAQAVKVDIKGKRVEFRKVETKNYTIEVPAGWEVGEETPFGQREITPSKSGKLEGGAAMSSMTGPGLGKQGWDQLYQTSLFFITKFSPNGDKMKATPYKLGKSKQGFDTCSWTMNDTEGKPLQKLVILKHENGNILALGVKMPTTSTTVSRGDLEAMFQRMVETAIVK